MSKVRYLLAELVRRQMFRTLGAYIASFGHYLRTVCHHAEDWRQALLSRAA